MSLFVVDASVAAKWLVQEQFSEQANLLVRLEHRLIAPDLLLLEVASVLTKKVRRGELTEREARDRKEDTRERVGLVPSAVLSGDAFELALRFQRGFYDALYLALAINSDCQLVTADRRLVNGLSRTPLASTALWIEDLPDAQSD
ncbi:MAG TPA: type II toxin-antitoxin system VapC family toxin [Dehalococcoidia bacterium]|nr:type II toxin-antitoxin system VapC family toxin [Dehalococcoidia bacterium]